MSGVRVIRGGMLTTIQDTGRWGYQSRGVPVAGPMRSIARAAEHAVSAKPRRRAGVPRKERRHGLRQWWGLCAGCKRGSMLARVSAAYRRRGYQMSSFFFGMAINILKAR